MLQYAVLAPSSHNTQPWYFKVEATRVLLYADRTRALPANDPHDRELTISCGCALMNLRVAASQAGMIANVLLSPDPDDDDLLALIDLKAGQSVDVIAALFPAITKRRTYRKTFEAKPIPRESLFELSRSAKIEDAWLLVLNDVAKRYELASLVAEGDAIQWANTSWRRELSAWMHHRRKGDGLTVPGVIAPAAQVAVRTFNMGKLVGARDRQLTMKSPVVAVLGTDHDGVDNWMKAGQALQRVLLHATIEGLQASYLNQAVQVESMRPKVQELAAHQGYPQIVLRLGYPKGIPAASSRRALDDVIA